MCGIRCLGCASLLLALFIGLTIRAGDPPPRPSPRPGTRPPPLHLDTVNAHAVTRCIYQRRVPDGFPLEEDFGVATLPLRSVSSEEVLVRSTALSVDPYMRASLGGGGRAFDAINTSAADALDLIMQRVVGGENVGVVVESRAAKLPVGSVVRGRWHWCEAAVLPAAIVLQLAAYHKPASSALGVLGMPGRTAYHGLFEVLRPKKGEVLFVSGAHGATGAVAGQLGKIAGLRVLGSAGSTQKVQELYDLGFDGAFNYREESADEALDRLAPGGIDLYFDNTGGPVSEAVAFRLRDGGRVAVCGQIHWYEMSHPAHLVLQLLHALLPSSRSASLWMLVQPLTALRAFALKAAVHVGFLWSLAMAYQCERKPRSVWTLGGGAFTFEGFMVNCFDQGRPDHVEQEMAKFVQDGRLKIREDVLQGTIEDAPRAFIRMLSGANRGKQILDISMDSRPVLQASTAASP